jgi:hypothetical protein
LKLAPIKRVLRAIFATFPLLPGRFDFTGSIVLNSLMLTLDVAGFNRPFADCVPLPVRFDFRRGDLTWPPLSGMERQGFPTSGI